MTRQEKQDRLMVLQEKAAFGELTAIEETEASNLTDYLDNTRGPKATEEQLSYIDILLDELGGYLYEYTDFPLEDLTVEAASLIIDEIKEDLEFWD